MFWIVCVSIKKIYFLFASSLIGFDTQAITSAGAG
jgi:hypothetical protein